VYVRAWVVANFAWWYGLPHRRSLALIRSSRHWQLPKRGLSCEPLLFDLSPFYMPPIGNKVWQRVATTGALLRFAIRNQHPRNIARQRDRLGKGTVSLYTVSLSTRSRPAHPAAHSLGAMTRRVNIAGVPNMRDLGGLPAARGITRTGLIFRSGRPGDAGKDGIEHLVGILGIRTIVDLRGKAHETNDVRAIYPVVTATKGTVDAEAGATNVATGAELEGRGEQAAADSPTGQGQSTIPIKYINKDVQNGMVVRMGWLRVSALLAGFGSMRLLTCLKAWAPVGLARLLGQIKGRLQYFTLHHTLGQGESNSG